MEKKKIKGLFCIRRGAPKLSKLPERNSLFLPDCAQVFICPARAVVSRAFVSVGAALRWPGPLLGVCFLVLRTWGERRSQAGMFFMARRTAAVQSFILGLMWLLQFSSPSLTEKRQIWDLDWNDCVFNYAVSQKPRSQERWKYSCRLRIGEVTRTRSLAEFVIHPPTD